ncbi:MAG: RagB/SusD family nutrient uptake outer membrane protein [Chitinophagaceae bacterium]|nr:RagB/SusD family nutrient uptake outer membrane protein [Chitinophagaceae bacterium]
MKNIPQLKIWTLIVGLFMTTVSCNKEFLETPLPTNALAAEGAFSSLGAIKQLNNQLHTDFQGIVVNNSRFEPYADNGYNALNLDKYTINNLTPRDEGLISWKGLYKAIFSANLMLEGLPTADAVGLDDNTRNQYIGAARTVRAFALYQLVRLYGDVPLVTTTSVEENKFKPRTPKADVYAQIETDLLDAIAKLSATITVPYYINNKYIPQAILADVYLTQGKWTEAQAAANAVISSGKYQLDNIDDVFLRTSKATIMATGYLSASSANYAQPGPDNCPSCSAPAGSYGAYIQTFFEGVMFPLTADLLNSFETGDLRKVKWVLLNNLANYPNNNERMFPLKYKWTSSSGIVPPAAQQEDNKFIRLAEIILIRAETRARLNDLSGAAADLNSIRNRAGLLNTTAISQTDIIDAIIKERRMEFFFEKGIRWYDLVRTGKANATLSVIPYKTGWTIDKVLMPIPQDEIDKSANVLTPNPGY